MISLCDINDVIYVQTCLAASDFIILTFFSPLGSAVNKDLFYYIPVVNKTNIFFSMFNLCADVSFHWRHFEVNTLHELYGINQNISEILYISGNLP